ncbi:MAG: hypothetical protein AB7O52_18880 [Planctomycetota bacterium]
MRLLLTWLTLCIGAASLANAQAPAAGAPLPTPPPETGPTEAGAGVEPRTSSAERPTVARAFQGGVCWVGSANTSSLAYLVDKGVRWISVTPFGYGQEHAHQPPPAGYTHSRHRGESIAEVREVIRQARAASLKVMLKPHIWFAGAGGWCGDIAMQNPGDWQLWFQAYRDFLDPFIDMAREEQVEIFCLGTELGGTVAQAAWTELIAEARSRYGGQLTYAANWYQDYDRVPFWPLLDYIGVQAYFPLTEQDDPTTEDIVAGWKRWTPALEAVATRAGRPVLLTEFGYKPVLGTTIRPWEWRSEAPLSPDAQARAYEAAFRALADEEWFHGAYVWKWFSGYSGGEFGTRRRRHDNFSPQGLPAEQVMERWYRQLQPSEKRKTAEF